MSLENKKKEYVKVIPLGGLGEVGKNMTVFETENDIIIVDCGLSFPDENMPGIDLVIPDMSYLDKKKDKIRGLFITHGHEDHIGGVSYFLSRFNVPVYGTGLTLGILEHKLDEKRMLRSSTLRRINAGETIKVGDFSIECIHVNHSIADSLAFCINTPVGRILHTGDFKIDYTPLYDDIADVTRFGQLGQEGIRLLLMDSTNAEKVGKTDSERAVYRSFEDIFSQAYGLRMTFATFSTNTNRIQTIFNLAHKYGRKVALTGRSMVTITDVAMELGYIKIPEDTLIGIDSIDQYDYGDLVILTTGSQGETMSALSRMAIGEHKKVKLGSNDVVVLSAHAIPGNEKSVSRIINSLLDIGVTVVHDKDSNVHVSGHGCQDELSLMYSLVKPENFMPVHGESRQMLANKKLAIQNGMDPKNIHIGKNGSVLVLTKNSCGFVGEIEAGSVFVDGNGVGDIGSVVLKDRKTLSQDGLVIAIITIDNKKKKLILTPDIISRGFVYVKESEDLINDMRKIAKNETTNCLEDKEYEWSSIKTNVRDSLYKYIRNKTNRTPMILPVIISV